MTFAAKSKESASERFFLVKLTARRYLSTGTLSAGKYNFTIPANLNIEAVTINGENISASNYTYTSTTLTITSALNLAIISNVVTLDHNIFLTGTKTRDTSGVSGIPDATWEPLIANYPSFSQSMRNITEGVFSLSNTDITLICIDRWGQSLIGKPDATSNQYESLSNAPISVWACIDTAEDNRKIFDGEVASVSYNYGQLQINILDTFQKLKNTASFGTRAQSHVYTGNGSMFPRPADENTTIPMVLGKSSPFKVGIGYRHVDSFSPPSAKLYYLEDGQRAILTGPNGANQSSTTTWVAGRFIGLDLKKLTFGSQAGSALIVPCQKVVTGLNTYNGAFGVPNGYSEEINGYYTNYLIFLRLSNINNFNGEIGDFLPASSLPFSLTSIGAIGAAICGYGTGLNGVYNVAAYALFSADQNTALERNPISQYSDTVTLPADNTYPAFSCWVEAGDNASYEFDAITGGLSTDFNNRSTITTKYLMPASVYTASGYTLADKNISTLFFTLGPNPQINLADSVVKFRFSPAAPLSHSEALKFIVKSAGMTTNDATFTQADSDLAANVSLSFPQNQASEFGSYLEASQAITSSTLGILRVNQSRQVEYELIKNPQSLSTDGTRDKINMLLGDTYASVDYQDIVTSVEFENPQLINIAALSGSGPKSVVDFPIAKQIHRVERSKIVQHVLESIQNRKDAIAGYLSEPTVEYSLATASEDLASSIGDVIEITNVAVADTSQTTKGIIVGLDQSGSTTKVKINEIRGVS